jgi:hypothetical protein
MTAPVLLTSSSPARLAPLHGAAGFFLFTLNSHPLSLITKSLTLELREA